MRALDAAACGTQRMDLMQVHNLVDWRTHLATLRAWKEAGPRPLHRRHALHSWARSTSSRADRDRGAIDFVQLPYSHRRRATPRSACCPRRPATGVAVLVMRPFEAGALFARVRGKPLPPWAADFDCASWAQFFLKFILGHPAVTCPIPATASAEHLADNLGRRPRPPARRGDAQEDDRIPRTLTARRDQRANTVAPTTRP